MVGAHAQVIRHYHGHLSGVYSLALHPTLDVLMTGGRDSVCRVWDMRTKCAACPCTQLTRMPASCCAMRCGGASPRGLAYLQPAAQSPACGPAQAWEEWGGLRPVGGVLGGLVPWRNRACKPRP